MSTRRFCDLCDAPSVGDAYDSVNISCKPVTSPLPKLGQITVSINFHFKGHPSGFGGPPDLCETCRTRLLLLAIGQRPPKTKRSLR